jgi:hypothetical protein
MTRARPIAVCAAILDAADEAGARALLAGFAERHGLDVVRSGWEPYRKLGPHSRIWFWWRLAEGETHDHLAALDRLAARLVAPADRSRIDRRLDDDEAGAPELSLVVAGNCVAIVKPGLLWLDLEIDLEPAVQADLEAALTS